MTDIIVTSAVIGSACLGSFGLGVWVGRVREPRENAHARRDHALRSQAPYKVEPPVQAVRRPAHYKTPEELVNARPWKPSQQPFSNGGDGHK